MFDLVTRIIPGGILVLSIIYISSPSSIGLTARFSILFVVASLISGEFINLFRMSLYIVPRSFRRVLFFETNNKKYLGKRDKVVHKLNPFGGIKVNEQDMTIFYHTTNSLEESLRTKFDLSGDPGSYDLYTILESSVRESESARTQRLRTAYLFYSNTIFSLLFTSILSIFVIIISIIPQLDVAFNFLGSLLTLLITGLFLFILDLGFSKIGGADALYVDSIVADYYVMMNE